MVEMRSSRPRRARDPRRCPWLTVRGVSLAVEFPGAFGELMRFPSGCPSSAGYKFVARLISAAFEGKTGVVEPSYVYVKDDAALQKEIGESIDFFSVPVELGVRPLSFFTSLERSEIAELS